MSSSATRVDQLQPRVPEWALWSGLPEPHEAENFVQYVSRMGLDPGPLLQGLTDNSLAIANRRLATELMRQLPSYYEGWVEAVRRSRATF
jgi:hypothetical protein